LDYRSIAIKCVAVVAKNKFCVKQSGAEMETKWEGTMGVLKDHMSYTLVPEIKELTDLVAAYTLRFINHLAKCCEIQNKISAIFLKCRKL